MTYDLELVTLTCVKVTVLDVYLSALAQGTVVSSLVIVALILSQKMATLLLLP